MTKNKKIILGMSGGVDSSVAALLLQKQGYEVVGMFMNCGIDKNRWPTTISWNEEQKDVKAICKKLKIKLIVKDTAEDYEINVISKMFRDYGIGLTPNPDILCNNVGKFPLLYKTMLEEKAQGIATGHYARVKKINGKTALLTGLDKTRDQSYFLVGLAQKYLSKTIFPIGNITKKEVREIAKKNDFKNWDKKGSRGICYLGKINMKDFLKSRIPKSEGNLLDTSGNIIGTHPGFQLFTIGETITSGKGVKLNKNGRKMYSSDKLYVCNKKKNNILIVAKKNDKSLKTRKILIHKFKPIDKNEILKNRTFFARIRHLGEFYEGKLSIIDKEYTFNFTKKVEAVAPGQFIVLYNKDRVVGGGEIRRYAKT